MNIKLRARLKAYGKLDISQDYLPHTSADDAGKFLGVDKAGNYTLFANASEHNIDTLFTNDPEDPIVTDGKKSFIDSMF